MTSHGVQGLTVGVLQRLLLLGGLGDDLDPLAEEDSDVGAVPVEHLHRQHEVLPLVRVRDVQRLGRAEVLRRSEIKHLLHIEGVTPSSKENKGLITVPRSRNATTTQTLRHSPEPLWFCIGFY